MSASTPGKSPGASKRGQMLSEAKALSAELRTLVKSKDLATKEVEFARQKLRRQYTAILFAAQTRPASAASSRLLDTVNQLWMDTSHSFINRYRQKVSAIDKAIAEQQKQKSANATRRSPANGNGSTPNDDILGPTARRRLIHTFRQFLSNEENFWADLLVRLVKTFDVEEAKGALSALGIPAEPQLQSERGDPTPPVSSAQTSNLMRAQALLLCHRVLICFGDLSRYRELYNDNDYPTATNGKGRNHQNVMNDKRGKNWSKAAECYHQARLLVPDNGNPSNQLAVLASYDHDTLSSMYHYYRALCVMQEFPTARPNLELTFTKALSKSKPDLAPDPNQTDSITFQSEFVILQALIFHRRAKTEIEMQTDKVAALFSGCLSQRLLPSETIVKVVCTCIAALFDVRMQGSRVQSAQEGAAQTNTAQTADFEQSILAASMETFRVLFESSAAAVANPPQGKSDTDYGASLQIAPVLRRTLPALRIVSKWLLGQPTGKTSGNFSFWQSYADFFTQLAVHFPTSTLPGVLMASCLEENIDMAGFLPLAQSMTMPSMAVRTAQADYHARHPSEEHMMRVADLLADLQLALGSRAIPVLEMEGVYVATTQSNSGLSLPSISIPAIASVYTSAIDEDVFEDDDLAENDILDLAMRAHSMDAGQDDAAEDDQILFPYTGSPVRPGHATPTRPSLNNRSDTDLHAQTASDLLLQVLNGQSPALNQQSPSHSPRGQPSATPNPPQVVSSSIGTINPAAASIWNSNARALPPPNAASGFGESIWNLPLPAAPAPVQNRANAAWNYGAPGSRQPPAGFQYR